MGRGQKGGGGERQEGGKARVCRCGHGGIPSEKRDGGSMAKPDLGSVWRNRLTASMRTPPRLDRKWRPPSRQRERGAPFM
jgi:hypothetical protein